MMNSLFAGVSGLRNHLTKMDVIGNNIANINTLGFKAGRTTFKEMLAQTIRGASRQRAATGGVNPLQYGLGMAVASIDNIFSQGGLEMTGKSTDLAIQGNGFFILSDGVSNYYTRAGNFSYDATGYLVDPGTGYILQGKMADSVTGEIPSGTAIEDIQLPLGQTAPANATTNVSYSGNLDTDAATATEAALTGSDLGVPISITEGSNDDLKIKVQGVDGSSVEEEITLTAGTYDTLADIVAEINNKIDQTELKGRVEAKAVGSAIRFKTVEKGSKVSLTLSDGTNSALETLGFADGATDSGTDDSYSTSIKVYDSLGGTHTLTLAFAKTAENEWSWVVSVTGAQAGTVSGNCGTVTFESDGSLDPTKFQYDNGATSFEFTPDNGAAPMSITFDPGTGFNGLTQFRSPATAIAKSQDGYGMGTLDSISIDSSGIISGIFTNGVTRNLAQIVLADFNNPAGLLKVGDNMYKESANSGQAVKAIARSTISGSVSSGYLEMSNVDLAQEFTKMIIAQRGFQANARTITTTDNMLGELVNLKR